MTTEDLMKPRYKIIADYPGSPFFVEEILEFDGIETAGIGKYSSGVFVRSVNKPDKYPHVFKPLTWWEERKPEDMPGYVKLKFDNRIHYVHKVEKWAGENYNGQPLYEYINKVNYQSTSCVIDLEPATESEYNEFINNK